MGFAYFENRSKSNEYDYLSKVLPISLAASIEANYGINTRKPAEIDQALVKNGGEPLKPRYSDRELPELSKKIGQIDYFLYGHYQTLEDNSIDISISIYDTRTLELFTFSTVGKMEVEVFHLVDRLTGIMNDFLGKEHIYQEIEIPEKAKIGFITNLDAESLNRFYMPFMEKGFGIIATQSNELENHLIDDPMREKLKYLALKKTLFDRVRKGDPIKFEYSPAFGRRAFMYQQTQKDLIKKYYYSYPEMQDTALKKLAAAFKFKIDFLILVMFNESGTEAWLRCFDLRRFDSHLVWLQSGIQANGKYTDPASGIAGSILEKFRKNEKPKKQN